VRSLGFYVRNRSANGESWRKPRQLNPFAVQPHGHRAVALSDGNGMRVFKVHRLALLAFRGPPPPGRPNGLHRDDVPDNNHLENLYWGTRSQNGYDSVAHGNHVQARKTTCELGHLLAAPNLVECTAELGYRSCLACKLAQANHLHDARLRAQGKERTRYNRGRDGFIRRRGETVEQEAHRRYAHIMRDQLGGL